MMEEHELTDVWRISNPDKTVFTLHSNGIPRVSCLLECIVATTKLLNNTPKGKLVPVFFLTII